MRSCNLVLLTAACIAFSAPAFAQQSTIARAADTRRYDVRRETNVIGTVVSFEAYSKAAPYGARLILQASSGVLEVHLGDARLLSANHFTIQPGDSLRIVGEPLSAHQATYFVARIVQKGTQALLLRTPQGSLIPYVAPRAAQGNAVQRGAV